METVRWEELMSEENRDLEARSDTELEQNKDRLSKDVKKEERRSRKRIYNNSSPWCWSGSATNGNFPFSKTSQEETKDQRWKKSLDGLYQVLAPGSSVVKTGAYTSAIKEPGKREVTIRNSDLAIFGTKAELQTDLQIYANWRPKVPSGKITEDLINQHTREARRMLEGIRKTKHPKIADDASAVSTFHSYATRALKVRTPIKPKKTIVPAPPQTPSENLSDSAPPIELPITSIVFAEPPSRPERKAATKATAAPQPSTKRKRSSPSITESYEYLASVQKCPPSTSSFSAPSRSKKGS